MELPRLTGSIFVFVLAGLLVGPALSQITLEIITFFPHLFLLPPLWKTRDFILSSGWIWIIVGLAFALFRYKSGAPFVFSGSRLFIFLLGCLAGIFNLFYLFFGWLSRTTFYSTHQEILETVWNLMLPWGYIIGFAPLLFDVTFSTLVWSVPLFIVYRLYLKDKVIAI